MENHKQTSDNRHSRHLDPLPTPESLIENSVTEVENSSQSLDVALSDNAQSQSSHLYLYSVEPHRTTSVGKSEIFRRDSRSIQDDKTISENFVVLTNMTESEVKEIICVHPEYLVFTWVMCLVALATTLKLYFLIKTLLAFFMVTFYALLVVAGYPNIFIEYPESKLKIPLTYQMLLLLFVFLMLVAYHARLVEVTSRLDFLWKREAQRELAEMRETRSNNRQLLRNILPDHVANHFLTLDRQAEELYSQSRDNVGVMFASIPNFTEFYSEDINKGIECIRLLNEIIVDFDELLAEPRFASIEKIKTVGASYMAASGLNPTHKEREAGQDHICALVDFAIAMKQSLDELNKHSFNNFQLRVGISSGALVGGVIGARKPVYDIWGNTVNEASRMDSTGTMGRIQIPKETAMMLIARGYQVEYRGLVAVKGKGEMETYYVAGRGGGAQSGFARTPSQHASLAAVVFGMVQARRRQNTVKRPNPQKQMKIDTTSEKIWKSEEVVALIKSNLKENSGLSRTKSQNTSSSRVFESSLSPRGGARQVIFRSFRQTTPGSARRSGTARPARPESHAQSYQNIRQLSVDPRLMQHSAPQSPLPLTPSPRSASPASPLSLVLKPTVRSVSMNFATADNQDVR